MRKQKADNAKIDDRSSSSANYAGQQNQKLDKKRSDLQAVSAMRGTNSPKSGGQSERDVDTSKDVDDEGHPEAQVKKQKQHRRPERKFNDKSERV